MSSDILLYRKKGGQAFSAPVLSGSSIGGTTLLGTWEEDWAHIVSFRFGEAPFILLYRNSGVAFTAPVLGGSNIGPTTHIGNWAGDWDQIASFEFGGAPYLLLYRRSDGYAFTVPILSPTTVGETTLIGRWEQDWAHLVPFRFNGAPYLLLYRDSGVAFTAPILSGTHIGSTTNIGNWESDWAQIVPFRANGSPYFLLYRNSGGAFTAPILSATQIGPAANIGNWENDWAQILSFDILLTENFAYAWDPILTELEVINASQLLASLPPTTENDFLTVQSLFRKPGGFGAGNRILIWVTNQIVSVGGGHNFGYSPNDRKSQISISAAITDPRNAKAALVAELAEIFMSYQGKWNSGNSMGEALSMLTTELLYPNPGFVGNRVSAWMNSKANHIVAPSGDFYSRPDWVTVTEATDADIVSYGCGMVFLYWLHTVKGISYEDIIAASGSTFVECYKNLTGASDGWLQFHNAVDKLYPETNNPNFVWKQNNIFL